MLPDNTVNSLCSHPNNKSIAFDFDGTIVDCKIRQVEVLRSILRKKDINLIQFDYDSWWDLKLNGSSTYNALIKMNVPDDIAEKISKYWISTIENVEWLDFDKLSIGCLQLFEYLHNEGFSISVITARRCVHNLLNQIKKLSIERYISQTFIVNPFKSIKEKQEILDTLKPFAFIGDSENDFLSAKNSGVRFIAIATGQRSKKFLLDKGVDIVIDKIYSPLSLYNILNLKYMIHPTSEVQSKNIGKGTMIWQYCVILENAVIGDNCNINFNVFVENDVIIGDNVTIKSGVQLWDGLVIGNNVFISPNVTFTNDLIPRSKQFPDKFLATEVKEGASIGANSTIIGGITIGKFSMIGAGSIVTKNIPDHTLWYGCPAVFKANICKCGNKLSKSLICSSCNTSYNINNGQIEEQ